MPITPDRPRSLTGSITKTLHVARREFKATVLTKGFIIGVLVMPFLMMGAVPAAMLLVTRTPPAVNGSVAIIDRSDPASPVASALAAALAPASIEEWVRNQTEETTKQATDAVKKIAGDIPVPDADAAIKTAAASIVVPKVQTEVLPTTIDEKAAKDALIGGTPYDGSRLALVIIDPSAITKPDAKAEFGGYALFIKQGLDARVQGMIREKTRTAIFETRAAANGLDPVRVRSITRIDAPDTVTWTKEGEKSSGEAAQFLVPLGFMMLLWISVFTGGQYLLTSTIEEKSNRIMEVLLSAISPMELMTGKILGQMGAGLLILVLYSVLGISSLIAFQQSHLVNWSNLFLLVIYFFIAFATIACMMAAVGSAVNDIHEAQALMTPFMLVLIAPMLLMMPIIMNPNGKLATALSFTPLINPFVMVLRLSSSDPPPLWQIPVSILIGTVTVYLLARTAAKVFRIGVLMYGKPPNFTTLVRWVKMA